MSMNPAKAIDALLGVAVGDAVGVPYEFTRRHEMADKMVLGMVGHGTHDQPAGTWSDDTSLTLCLAESLAKGYDLKDQARRFIRWLDDAHWTAHGEVFDVGIITSKAIRRLDRMLRNQQGLTLNTLRNGATERDNGNGSLMRILPLLFHIQGRPIAEQFERIWEVSALTHGHVRAAMSCLIHLKLAEHLLAGASREVAYEAMRVEVAAFWDEMGLEADERAHFVRVVQNDIRSTHIDDLRTGGYVIEVLESSIWFLLNRHSFKDTILSIVALGHDTDTSAAIAGGLAGLHYGREGMPAEWVEKIARVDEIVDLGRRLGARYRK
jgi:ADP-ribosylglycohydrolase